jgi:hypothetical protein
MVDPFFGKNETKFKILKSILYQMVAKPQLHIRFKSLNLQYFRPSVTILDRFELVFKALFLIINRITQDCRLAW